MDTFVFFLEIIGTVAFASSGAMTAIEKNACISVSVCFLNIIWIWFE